MAPDRPSGDFGSKLRAARERRGVTLRQIANQTKIAVSVLEALERNDISRLPGGIFGRAFVRSYAVEVGLDPEETIRDFIAQFPHDSVTAGHPATEQIEDSEALESDRRTASTFLRLILISIPVAVAVIYLGASGRLSTGKKTAAPPATLRHAPPLTPTPTPTAAPSPAVAVAVAEAPAPTKLTIAVTAFGPCWLSATVDGVTRPARTLQRGDAETFDVRRELELTAGDAGALVMAIDGVDAKPLGKNGEKVTRRVNLDNFKTFLPSR
jgi:cytoskeletal protein RodZ